MKRWGKRIGYGFVILLALVGLRSFWNDSHAPRSAIGVLEMNGALWVAEDWLKTIEQLRKDPNVLGVVVRINSPGGVVAASQEIFEALHRLREKKPVVASMGSVAASGGLYIALAANKIFANPGTITGSIGVRMEHIQIGDLLRSLKIEYNTIKSGRFKDLASSQRPLDPEERAILETMMAEIHQQFKEVVASSRKLEMAKVEPIADGRIFTGAKAKEFGLVDEIGGLSEAVAVVAKMVKIEGEPKLYYPEKPSSWWVKTFFSTAKAAFLGPQICFLYR